MNDESEVGGGMGRERFVAVCGALEGAIAARAFPGCAFGVSGGGETQLLGALGQFTYEADAARVTPSTVFDIASVSKVVATTAMAMLLWQRGLLDLNAPVGELLPEFLGGRAADDRTRRVTIKHLLAHNSGLPGYVRFYESARDAAEVRSALMGLQLEAEPGARAEYSDPGFMLLGMALERLTGEEMDVWVEREVFKPLAMSGTRFRPTAKERATIPPTEYDGALRHRIIQGEVQDENAWLLGGVAGHAGVFSTVTDLLRFAGEILAAERRADSPLQPARLFEARTVAEFARRQGPEGSSRALGWDTPSPQSSAGKYFSKTSLGHLGYSGCSLWIDRECGVAAVLLTNRTWPDRSSQLIKQVRPAFHDALREAGTI